MALVCGIADVVGTPHTCLIELTIYRPRKGVADDVTAKLTIIFDSDVRHFGTVIGGCPTGIDLYSTGDRIEMIPIVHQKCTHLIREEMNIRSFKKEA